MTGSTPANPLKLHAKLSQAEIGLSVDLFAQGISVNRAAKAAGVSGKTMRGLYIALRDRLHNPAFARWHRANAVAPGLITLDQQITAKVAFFDLMAACHEDEYCHRNFKAGRRKDVQCRGCPLRGRFSSQASADEAVAVTRLVRTTYAALNIGMEHGQDPVALFRRRLIHVTVLANVLQSSHRLPKGNLDPNEDEFLSFGVFRRTLMVNLIREPLGSHQTDE